MLNGSSIIENLLMEQCLSKSCKGLAFYGDFYCLFDTAKFARGLGQLYGRNRYVDLLVIVLDFWVSNAD